MTPVNEVDFDPVGMSARSVSGTDVVTPSGVLSCTEADRSPGWAGSGASTVTVRLAPGGMVSVSSSARPWRGESAVGDEDWDGPLQPDALGRGEYGRQGAHPRECTSHGPELPAP